MRNAFAGLALATGLICGALWAQEAQPQTQPGQPKIQPRQPQTQPLQPGQPGQPAAQPTAGQPKAGQPLQPGQPLTPAQPARGQLTQPAGQPATADQQIAAKIHGCANNEIELSKFAQTKLQSAEARAFAEKMVRDHSADAESYQRWAGRLGDAAARPDEGAVAAPRGGPFDWNKIHEQIAQQCLASAKQELGRHQGSEFDQAFMGMQLGGHLHMQDELKVLRNYASPDLQQQIDKSLQVVQGHLSEARQVMQTLKDRPSERVSRRPEDKK